MITPLLPDAKYTLTLKEGEHNEFVYFVAEVKKNQKPWPTHQNYLYRLIDPSQTSAIFVSKISANELVGLSLKKQKC